MKFKNSLTLLLAIVSVLSFTKHLARGQVALSLQAAAYVHDVYIAIRTDGQTGSGRVDDPFDGSTQVKFDAIMAAVPPNTAVHVGPGTFLTKGQIAWSLKTRCKVLGSGRDMSGLTLASLSRVKTSFNAKPEIFAPLFASSSPTTIF